MLKGSDGVTTASIPDFGGSSYCLVHCSLSLAVATRSMHSLVLPSASRALARFKMSLTPLVDAASARRTDSGVG